MNSQPDRKIHVLFVEDSASDQHLLEGMIKRKGLPYDYLICDTVAEALRLMGEGTFDIIVADYLLPDGTGFGVLEKAADVPVIIVTGAGSEKVAVEAMKRGAVDYLVKHDDQSLFELLPLSIDRALERREAQLEKKALKAQLQHSQRLELVGTLASGFAHDFNNVLASVLGYSELAAQDINPEERAYCNIREAIVAVKRAKDLVQQILSLGRQQVDEKSEVDLEVVVEEVDRMLMGRLAEAVEIKRELKGGSLRIIGNPTQLHQVLLNLCINAEHSMGSEGGIITIGIEDVKDEKLPTSCCGMGRYVRLYVKDTGCGIIPEVAEKIFDPFFTTKAQGEGTGMGLAIVDSIVEGHGGVIKVESEIGKGTRFDIYLPMAEAGTVIESHRGADSGETEEHSSKGHILIVDDEKSLVEIATRMLERCGYEVTGCFGGEKALEVFEKNPMDFDLVITDLSMPKIDGEILGSRIRELRQDIPLVLCTGYGARISDKVAFKLGFKRVLEKPLSLVKLSEIVGSILKQGNSK